MPEQPLLQIPPEEWADAKAYFAQHSEIVKYRKIYAAKTETEIAALKAAKKEAKKRGESTGTPTYSFLNIKGQYYAMIDGETLGEGEHGRVKLIQTEAGVNFAVKIEGRGLRGEKDIEYQIMKMLAFIHAQAEVQYGKKYKGRLTSKKLYTILELKKGEELFKHLYITIVDPNTGKESSDKRNLDVMTKLIYAIKAAEAIAELHQKQIIHADIRPQNFMANNQGHVITVASIDFGLSMILKAGERCIRTYFPIGTSKYWAPEISDWIRTEYSFASDVYALGVMFWKDMGLTLGYEFDQKLFSLNPSIRPNIEAVIDKLYEELAQLAKFQLLSAQAQEMLKSYQEAAPVRELKQKIQPMIQAINFAADRSAGWKLPFKNAHNEKMKILQETVKQQALIELQKTTTITAIPELMEQWIMFLDQKKGTDMATNQFIQKMQNSIHDLIKFTRDYKNKCESGKATIKSAL